MLKKEDVKHIATLARIGLGEDDIEKYEKDLSSVLDYFKKLEELDTANISPIGHITGRENSLRGDIENDFGDLKKEKIRNNFPEKKDNQIKVRSVL